MQAGTGSQAFRHRHHCLLVPVVAAAVGMGGPTDVAAAGVAATRVEVEAALLLLMEQGDVAPCVASRLREMGVQ